MIEKTFPRGGKIIPHRKRATESKPIVVLPAPSEVVIPLHQSAGFPSVPLVEVGDKVKMGQKIGKAEGFISAAVHASVSGEVIAVEERPLLSGEMALSVVIKNDGLDDLIRIERPSDFMKMAPEAIRRAVKEAGIVGMGGAGFPTHIKLDPPVPVQTFLINGAECEPYLTCDHRLMVERGLEMVGGLLAMIRASGADEGVICIESNKPDAIGVIRQVIEGYDQLSVAVLQARYPQGAEKQLIKAVLNKEVPSGCLPCEMGCVVNNVHTAIAVYEALNQGKSSYERVVTVSGGAIVDPRNVLVRVGTPIQTVIDFCGGFLGEPEVVVAGGPMTGAQIVDFSGPTVKALAGIIGLSKEEADFDENRPCIRCSRCVQACPMGLVPNLLGEYASKGWYEKARKLRIDDCIECGLCSYACPSKRALFTWIKDGKQAAAEQLGEQAS